MKNILGLTVFVFLLSGAVSADILWSGDVSPSNPSTWDSNINGTIGNTGNGTLDITGGSDVVNRTGYVAGEFGSTSVVTVDGLGSTWTNNSYLLVGEGGNGTLNITGGGVVNNIVTEIGVRIGSTGEVNVDGSGSGLIGSNALYVGLGGNGRLNITDGGIVSDHSGIIGSDSSSTGEVTVDGVGSTWSNIGYIHLGRFSNGTLTITNGGLVSVGGTLTINYDGDGDDSFLNMDTGGMLALFGDGGDSIIEFLGLIDGTDAIRYWNGSNWTDIVGAVNGLDYTLEYLTEGDLAGYTMLTVPEPATMLLFGLGGVLLRKRKA